MIGNSLRALAWVLIGIIVALSLSPPSMRPITGAPSSVEHLVIFAVCGFAFGLGYRNGHVLQAFALFIFSGVIEILQRLVPGRHARLSDFVIDVTASCVGICIGLLLLRMPRGLASNKKR